MEDPYQRHHCKSDTQKSWARFYFPKISQTPVCIFLPFINYIHILWGVGSFQFGTKTYNLKNQFWVIIFLPIRNVSTNFCHFCLKKRIFQVSGLATGPKTWLLQSVCFLVSKVAGYFHNRENLFFVQHDHKPKHRNRLLDFPQLTSATYSNTVLRKKKRQIRHAESDQCFTSGFRGAAVVVPGRLMGQSKTHTRRLVCKKMHVPC